MATKTYGGAMADGGLVNAIEQPMSYLFTYGGTAPTGSALKLASFASAQVANTTYTVCAVVKGTDGLVYGAVSKTGTTAAQSIAGPGLSANAPGPKTGMFTLPGCGIQVPCWADGTVTWIQLSGPGTVQAVFVSNLDKSSTPNLLYISSWANLIAGVGGGIPNSGGAWKCPCATPESIYVIGDFGSALSVAIQV